MTAEKSTPCGFSAVFRCRADVQRRAMGRLPAALRSRWHGLPACRAQAPLVRAAWLPHSGPTGMGCLQVPLARAVCPPRSGLAGMGRLPAVPGSGTLEGAPPTSIWSIQHDGGSMCAERTVSGCFSSSFWSSEHEGWTNVQIGPFSYAPHPCQDAGRPTPRPLPSEGGGAGLHLRARNSQSEQASR